MWGYTCNSVTVTHKQSNVSPLYLYHQYFTCFKFVHVISIASMVVKTATTQFAIAMYAENYTRNYK